MQPDTFTLIYPDDPRHQTHLDYYLKAKENAIRKEIEAKIRLDVQQNPQKYIFHLPGLNDDLISLITKSEPQSMCNYAMVTISFPEQDFHQHLLRILQAVKRRPKYVSKMAVAYEYHTGSKNHPHVHIFIELDKTQTKRTLYKSTLIQDYYKKFSFMSLKQSNVDVRMHTTLKNQISYLLGTKKSPEKTILASQDVKWRQKIGIPAPDVLEFSKPESSENSSLPTTPPDLTKLQNLTK